jgi:Cys-rich repeat protein
LKSAAPKVLLVFGRLLLVGALAAVASCAEATPFDSGDLSACSNATDMFCTGPCSSDTDCKPGFHCDPNSHACVSCLMNNDCPNGQVCGGNHVCGMGCAQNHPCGDAGLCELDAGICVECQSDGDCTDKNRPRCNPANDRCVPCLPTKDNCGHATYCETQGMNLYACAPGCKDDSDCTDAPDGGAPATKCDTMKHVCVNCLMDAECPNGQVCHSGMCVAGCTQAQKCNNNLSCCNMLCVDPMTDYQNCGMCGNACNNGWNCCNATCSNPANDIMNCGGCGIVCKAMNGTPSCVLRNCAIAACNPGWADCDGSYLDGCEINIATNVGNCGGCNNPCNLPNASPKCVGGVCQVAACGLGFGDCDGNPMNGCETNIFSDVNNCNGCNMKCMVPHATAKCMGGGCAIALCDPGFLDCNNNPLDGCEVDSTSDVNHCGGCMNVCPGMNGMPTCQNSVCKIGGCSTGYADCDGNNANGCEVNLKNDVNHCGGCNTPCVNGQNVQSSQCNNGMCEVANCNGGFFDVDGNFGNGCECKGDAAASSCGGASPIGNIDIGQSQTRTGNLVGNVDDWYSVSFVGAHNSKSYNAQVALTTNPNNWFRIDVYADCGFNAISCVTEGGVSQGVTTWQEYWVDQQNNGQTQPIANFGTNNTVYVRVHRVAGPVTCDNYVLTVSD